MKSAVDGTPVSTLYYNTETNELMHVQYRIDLDMFEATKFNERGLVNRSVSCARLLEIYSAKGESWALIGPV